MIEKKRVVIFDDEDSTRQEWADGLRAARGSIDEFEILVVDNAKFEDALEILQARRAAARDEREISKTKTLFDETSILIVDYDLFKSTETTGEEVAYLARCFSECGTIVAVNQFVREGFTFDLTLLGHPDSFADVNLLANQISEPGLWRTPWAGFRPWYWPLLPRAVEAFEQRVLELEGNLDQEILEFLEIPPEVIEIFPVGAVEFISKADATFRSFVEESGKALRGRRERVASDKAVARIAAARLSKWLERLVLPGQNILVDAAHLLERYPSLFKGDSLEKLIGWPEVHELVTPGESIVDIAKIEPYRFKRNAWLSRTAWYWPLVSECEQISEVLDPWAPRPLLAFCEDTSRYVHPDQATEFVAKVDSPFVRRFVSTRDPRYGPQLQFAL